ncbi:MAG: sortase [Clostridiales bacterium]|nr:sortase [Clostridiales bacterium]
MGRPNLLGKIMMGLGLLLIVAALSLAGYSQWMEVQAAKNAQEALSMLDTLIPSADEDMDPDDAGMADDMSLTDGRDGVEADGDGGEDAGTEGLGMTVAMIDGMDYIGIVEIPVLSLRLPVLSSWSEEKLKVAPCRYEGSIDTGDLIISGHSYKQHFRYIRNLGIGDAVIFTDMDGNRYTYGVCGTEVVPGDGVEQMRAGEWDLTLFTCTYNGSARHTVRCRLIEEAENLEMENGQ